jgi:hypothetical protein
LWGSQSAAAFQVALRRDRKGARVSSERWSKGANDNSATDGEAQHEHHEKKKQCVKNLPLKPNQLSVSRL